METNTQQEQPVATEEAPQEPVVAAEAVEDTLPDWAREKLKKANSEAAGYRTQLREAQEALASAKSPEDVAAAIAAIEERAQTAEHQLNIARASSGIPTELVHASWVSWPKDEAGIAAVAEQLRKFAGVQGTIDKVDPELLSGGLDPANNVVPKLDPRTLAQTMRRIY